MLHIMYPKYCSSLPILNIDLYHIIHFILIEVTKLLFIYFIYICLYCSTYIVGIYDNEGNKWAQ